MKTVSEIIKLLRLEQWLKNSFVFLPLFFSGQFLNISSIIDCVIVFFVFSFAASSIYCFNDMVDAKTDREHPIKCKRPIASRELSVRTGYILMIISILSATVILLLSGNSQRYLVLGLIAFYYVMNIAYTLFIKKIAILDVICISIGFVLRIFAGGMATGIKLSEWIIMMTFLLALFLAFAKRRDDVVIFEKTGRVVRSNINRYNLPFMNQILSVLSAVTIIAYIMYTLSPEVTNRFNNKFIYLTSIFVIAGIIRYLQITIVDLNSENPTKNLYSDKFILGCVAAWIIAFLFIIYIK